MGETARLLAIGDVHLGTTCSGVPDDIFSLGIEPNEITPAAALESAVDFAIEEEVVAVLFAGDVVESTNARFEAMVPLEENVKRLVSAGIEVLAVAGNHDVEALPRLAPLIEGFTLLGEGGTWESRTVARNGTPVAEIIGWSFPERRVRHSPVAQLLSEPLERASTAMPGIGLLHADLDASGGSYAPVRQSELDDAGCDAWLLGHIHKPSIEGLSWTERPPSGYLGSLVGLDPSETGRHGPWLVQLPDGGRPSVEQVPLAPLRWEHVSVSIESLEHAEDVPEWLLGEAELLIRRIAEEGPAPRALGLRVRLTGASSRYDEIRQRISSGDWLDLRRVVDGTAVFINRITDAMSVPLDLAEIARGEDPAALLARRLLSLRQRDGQSEILLEEARAALGDVAYSNVWSPVQDHRNATDPLEKDALCELLLQSGMAALGTMLSQNEEGGRT